MAQEQTLKQIVGSTNDDTTSMYTIIRSIGATHGGFPVRKLRNDRIPKGYELVGYANNHTELHAVMFPN